MASLSVVVCRGCCCGTETKHPDVDHDGQVAQLHATRCPTGRSCGPSTASARVTPPTSWSSGAGDPAAGSVVSSSRPTPMPWPHGSAAAPPRRRRRSSPGWRSIPTPSRSSSSRSRSGRTTSLISWPPRSPTSRRWSIGVVVRRPSSSRRRHHALATPGTRCRGGRRSRRRSPTRGERHHRGPRRHAHRRLTGLVLLAAPDPLSRHKVHRTVVDTGPDVEAIDPEHVNATLVDLGIDIGRIVFGVRTDDHRLIALLSSHANIMSELLEAAGDDLVAASPTRVVASPLGRIEVASPIPPPEGQSPGQPTLTCSLPSCRWAGSCPSVWRSRTVSGSAPRSTRSPAGRCPYSDLGLLRDLDGVQLLCPSPSYPIVMPPYAGNPVWRRLARGRSVAHRARRQCATGLPRPSRSAAPGRPADLVEVRARRGRISRVGLRARRWSTARVVPW